MCIHMMDEGDVPHLSCWGKKGTGLVDRGEGSRRLKGGTQVGGHAVKEGVQVVRLQEMQGFQIKSSPAQQTHRQLKINRPRVLFFSEMRDERNSHIYCTVQLEYSTHWP